MNTGPERKRGYLGGNYMQIRIMNTDPKIERLLVMN